VTCEAELEKFRAALERIAEFYCEGASDDADTCAKLAMQALGREQTEEKEK
jgi:hypothetical protein